MQEKNNYPATAGNAHTKKAEEITTDAVKKEILRRLYDSLADATDFEKLAKTLNIICNLPQAEKPSGQPNIYERIRQEIERTAGTGKE